MKHFTPFILVLATILFSAHTFTLEKEYYDFIASHDRKKKPNLQFRFRFPQGQEKKERDQIREHFLPIRSSHRYHGKVMLFPSLLSFVRGESDLAFQYALLHLHPREITREKENGE